MSKEISKNAPQAYFEKIEDRFVSLVDENTFSKESSFAYQALRSNSYLSKTTFESQLQSVLNTAQCGLTLNPVLKLAHLVPRSINGKIVCCLEPSYQGLVKLVTDTGSAKTIYAHLVYEGDEFEEILGTNVEIIHKPKRTSTEVIMVYAVAILQSGEKQVEVMTKSQVDEIRAGSESYKHWVKRGNKGPEPIWVKHYGEMAKKTVIKRLVKYLPKTELWDKLGHAIKLDNEDYSITDSQKYMIDSLLRTANISQKEEDGIHFEIQYMDRNRASEVISYLKENQVDPILSGNAYNMGDIHNKIQKEIDG